MYLWMFLFLLLLFCTNAWKCIRRTWWWVSINGSYWSTSEISIVFPSVLEYLIHHLAKLPHNKPRQRKNQYKKDGVDSSHNNSTTKMYRYWVSHLWILWEYAKYIRARHVKIIWKIRSVSCQKPNKKHRYFLSIDPGKCNENFCLCFYTRRSVYVCECVSLHTK